MTDKISPNNPVGFGEKKALIIPFSAATAEGMVQVNYLEMGDVFAMMDSKCNLIIAKEDGIEAFIPGDGKQTGWTKLDVRDGHFEIPAAFGTLGGTKVTFKDGAFQLVVDQAVKMVEDHSGARGQRR